MTDEELGWAPRNVWKRYTADAARSQGTSQRTVRREAAGDEAIPDIAKLAGTSLDTPKELDTLAKLPPEKRDEIADRAKNGGKVSVAPRASTGRVLRWHLLDMKLPVPQPERRCVLEHF